MNVKNHYANPFIKFIDVGANIFKLFNSINNTSSFFYQKNYAIK